MTDEVIDRLIVENAQALSRQVTAGPLPAPPATTKASAAKFGKPLISVVVINYNRRDLLEQCLDSLALAARTVPG
ncbi:glycosyltransferase, partial [Salmonella enterica subsp. enterica serovar Istanbul]|nr:glycosyltransferase [Salmonella enterica subsp. enterica serovar Istanbul]